MSTGTREPVGGTGRRGRPGAAGPALPPTAEPPDGPDTGPIPAPPGGAPAAREVPPASGVSRVTVLAPHTRVDVALPADVPLAELVPVLLDMAGEPPGPGPGWTLALLGDAPADPERSLGGLGVLDGDQLVLRRAADAAPAPLYDDVVDAVAEATPPAFREWGPAAARAVGATALGVSATVALVALLDVGRGPGTAGGVVTAATAALGAVAAIGLGAVVARRGARDAVAGVLAVAGVGAAGVAGIAAVPATDSRGADPAPRSLLASAGAPHLLLAAALVALAAAAALAALGGRATADRRVLAALVALAASGLLGTVLGVATVVADALAPVGGGPDPAAVAAGAATLATLALGGLPRAGVALARLPLPPVPGSAREPARDDEPPPHAEIERRTDRAHAAMTGLAVAAALVAAAAATVLAALPAPGPRGVLGGVLAGLLVLLLALRSRAYANAVHASTLLLGAVAGAVGALLGALHALPPGTPGLTVAGAAVLGGGVAVLGSGPRSRPSPSARRAAGVVEAVAVAAVLPLALAVMDLYTVMRLL